MILGNEDFVSMESEDGILLSGSVFWLFDWKTRAMPHRLKMT